MSELHSGFGQAEDFRKAVRQTVEYSPTQVVGTVHEDPASGLSYVERVFHNVAVPFEVAQHAAYTNDHGVTQVPTSAVVATRSPLLGDHTTQPGMHLSWEFDPVENVPRSALGGPEYDFAAANRGFVNNMWRVLPDESGVQRATAFVKQIPTSELAPLSDDEKFKTSRERLGLAPFATQEQAWLEADILDSRAGFDEVSVVIGLIRSLPKAR